MILSGMLDVTESHIQHRRRMCLQLEQVSGRYVTARPRKGVASTDADFDSVVEKVRCETSFFLLRIFSSQSDKTSHRLLGILPASCVTGTLPDLEVKPKEMWQPRKSGEPLLVKKSQEPEVWP